MKSLLIKGWKNVWKSLAVILPLILFIIDQLLTNGLLPEEHKQFTGVLYVMLSALGRAINQGGIFPSQKPLEVIEDEQSNGT